MEKPDQPSTLHADLAALPAGAAWRIYWMRFLDRFLGPVVREALSGGGLLVIVAAVSLGGAFALNYDQVMTLFGHAWSMSR